MLNITVQASRIAVLAILICQGDAAFAQHCKDGSCCLKSRQGRDQLSAPTPRRSPSLNRPAPQGFDSSGNSGFGVDRPSNANDRALPSGNLTLQNRFQARPTRYPLNATRPSATVPTWETDLQKGVLLARESGRPMLIQVSASWCGYCRKMKSEVFAEPGIQRDLARGFVTVELDADQNREFVQRLGIKSLPTTLILAPEMQIADRMEGFRNAEQVQAKLNRFLPRAELSRDIELACR